MSILNYFIRVNEHAMLLEAMIAKLGLTESLHALPGERAVMKRAGQRCLSCDRPDDCANWLASDIERDEAPAYCRNHDLFCRMSDQAMGAAQNSP